MPQSDPRVQVLYRKSSLAAAISMLKGGPPAQVV